jgi:peroxiredoxin
MVARAAIKTLLLISIFVLADAGTAVSASRGSLLGSRAPDFALRDMNGNYVSISALRGKVLVLNFWATWCPPCKLEMPSLNRLHNDYRAKGLEVVAISTDSSEKGIRDYTGEMRLSLRILRDSDGRISELYGVYSLPTTYVIDQSGMVVLHYMGEQDWDSPKIRAELEALLNRSSQAPNVRPKASPVLFYNREKIRFNPQ